jgi:FkbM family methyltransferase
MRNGLRIISRIKCIESAVSNVEHSINDIRSFANWRIDEFHRLLKGICRFRGRDFCDVREEIGEERHQVNVENLKRGLSDAARQNLLRLLEKEDKVYYNKSVLITDFYDDNELNALCVSRRFDREISHVSATCGRGGGYYQWHSYKLPDDLGKFSSESSLYPMIFFKDVFLDKHGLDKINSLSLISENCNKAIVDVGCWIGDSALIFRDYFPVNPIYSFEPNPEYYKIAQKTFQINNMTNANIENLALGNDVQVCYSDGMNVNFNNCGYNAKMTTLDKYVSENKLDVGLIKVDIEGLEQNFLRGAYKTISEQRPILLISIYHSYNDFYNIKPLIESWGLQYEFDFFKGIDEGFGEIYLIAEPTCLSSHSGSN